MSFEMIEPNSDDRELLTPAGRDRHRSMCEQLQGEFVRFHRLRNRNRRAMAWSAVVSVILCATGLWWLQTGRTISTSSGEVAVQTVSPAGDPGPQVEPATSERGKSGIELELISDDQLLDMLAEAGQPSALAWIQGKPVVIPLENGPAL